ncbi:MAG: VIT1/CCC1 transporter family protein [Anaerolineae bacterium]|jgi:VIT1/CCC1 family predicted Fe2+/Mn2+ transporter|nr:VIT1/CCC1 transporter family protein [Anaerolineae bacterium]MDH7473928.1 VIT1/CCC1 transporter family protein [Anaerolineae bacterium]
MDVQIIQSFQRSEITEHLVYHRLAQRVGGQNGEILQRISDDELRHYNEWMALTQTEVRPNRLLALFYLIIARIFGLTFAIKLMERNEEQAERLYAEIAKEIPKAKEILEDELEHEALLVNMIDEERLEYIGSMVLGLNDALVELTGALAGLTFALQNTRLVGLAGFITGISASFSMAASEYLSTKSEIGSKDPLKASIYTGIVYLLTVMLLIIPYFLLASHYLALAIAILNALLVIFVFTFFVSVVKEVPFRKTWTEMVSISLGVALVSFVIGWAARMVLKVEF